MKNNYNISISGAFTASSTSAVFMTQFLSHGFFSQDNIVMNRLVPYGYKIKHQSRENRREGGVAILYKSTVSVDIKIQDFTQSMEYIDVCVSFENTPCELIVINRPGTNPNNGQFVPVSVFYEDLTSILRVMMFQLTM
eukprot:gene4211-20398_t